MNQFLLRVAVLCTGVLLLPQARAEWKPVPGHIMTRWAAEVSPENVLPEYPRPQMTRPNWVNLNGLWDLAILDTAEPPAAKGYDQQILVPFPVESALSGVKKTVTEKQHLFYRRTFKKPAGSGDRRLLLHFGAVDWHAKVWVNGKEIGEHKGGYDPFSFDITEALKGDGDQELLVRVTDPTDKGTQARGKQMSDPYAIWYTPVSGIWQTVWVEAVPVTHIQSLKITPDVDNHCVWVEALLTGTAPNATLQVKVASVRERDKSRPVKLSASGPANQRLRVTVPDAKLWSPDHPWLYEATVSLSAAGKTVDEVGSYFGMRKISLARDQYGHVRMMLNNKFDFPYGLLDQGWWPDGLYTAPTEEALRYDIEVAQRCGFNLLRKHVKVEPARWYYLCDQMGMLVWQDMPNGNLREDKREHLKIAPHEADAVRDAESSAQFETELKALIDSFYHFPCIVAWVPFNEGWGQYDTLRVSDLARKQDSTRLLLPTAGWTDRGNGDIRDCHMYPGPGMEPTEPFRAVVLGEFGGLGLPVTNHIWVEQKNWGYRTYDTAEELHKRYADIQRNLRPMVHRGLAGAIYTQVSDVEIEVNGLMTYDRAVLKFDAEEMRRLSQELRSEKMTAARWPVQDSESLPHDWSYTTNPPPTGWNLPSFDASDWAVARAPFGNDANPLFPSQTPIAGDRIWLYKKFKLNSQPNGASLKFTFGGKTRVYLNGTMVAEYDWDRARHYGDMNISQHVSALRAGENVIAVEFQATHEKQKRVDVGLYTY